VLVLGRILSRRHGTRQTGPVQCSEPFRLPGD